MQSKATNSSRLSAYHFVLKLAMTNALQGVHHIAESAIRRKSRLALGGAALETFRVLGQPRRCTFCLMATNLFVESRINASIAVISTDHAQQISRSWRDGAGDNRNPAAANLLRPCRTRTYYI